MDLNRFSMWLRIVSGGGTVFKLSKNRDRYRLDVGKFMFANKVCRFVRSGMMVLSL